MTASSSTATTGRTRVRSTPECLRSGPCTPLRTSRHGEDREKKPNEWPSYKAMVAFIADDPEYQSQRDESRYGIADAFEMSRKNSKPNGHASYDDDIEELIGRA